MKEQHLFQARTTLQFILATAMADQLRAASDATSTMLFIPGFLTPEGRAIDAWAGTPFGRTVVVVPRRQSGPMAATRRRAQIKRAVLDAIGAAPFRSVVVFKDQKDFGQTALIEVATRFPHAVRQCSDDGSQSWAERPHRAHRAIRQGLRFGMAARRGRLQSLFVNEDLP